jgi:hypothetical protein
LTIVPDSGHALNSINPISNPNTQSSPLKLKPLSTSKSAFNFVVNESFSYSPFKTINSDIFQVEDDRSLGDKIMDFLVSESDVTDEDIAQAELKRRQLEEKARMDHFQAQQTADLKERTMAEASRMQVRHNILILKFFK